MSKKRNIEERFWGKINKNTLTGCWLWTASICKKGYGIFWGNNKHIKAHRFSYELIKGNIPKGLVIDHFLMNKNNNLCFRHCVNPDHLEVITARANLERSSKYQNIQKIRGRKLGLSNKKSNLPAGVIKRGHNFVAKITLNNKQIWLGTFKSIEEASSKFNYYKDKF